MCEELDIPFDKIAPTQALKQCSKQVIEGWEIIQRGGGAKMPFAFELIAELF